MLLELFFLNSWGTVFDAVTVPVKGEALCRLQSAAGHLTGDQRESGGHMTDWPQVVCVCVCVCSLHAVPDMALLSNHIVFNCMSVFEMLQGTGSWKGLRWNECYASNGFLMITLAEVTDIPC